VSGQKLWTIQVAVIATSAEVDLIAQRISDVVCEEPDHPARCETPWILIVTNEDSLDVQEAQDLKDAILDR
jgi:hypothetical protein